jgi:hypothetical protein
MECEPYWLGIGWNEVAEGDESATHGEREPVAASVRAVPDRPAEVVEEGTSRPRRLDGRRFHLTEKNLERHLPGPGQRLYDTAKRGLMLRTSESSERSWYVVKFFASPKALAAGKKGETVYYRLGPYPDLGLEDAREKAQAALKLFAKGIDPRNHGREPDRAFEVVATKFVLASKRTRTYGETRRIVENELVPVWKGRDIGTIERRDVTALLEPIATRAPVMANRVAGVISRLFNQALDKGLIGANPPPA